MDALKKADEAKLITSEEPTSPTNWEDQLLPEFKQKLATIEQNTENFILDEVVNNENSSPVDWDAQFLPDFTVDKELPIKEEQPEIIPEITPVPEEPPVITTKPVTQSADTITAPQFTVKPVYSDSVNLNFVAEQVNTETSTESETVYPEDAQAILAAHSYKTSTRTYGLLVLLGMILVGFGVGYYYLDQLVTDSSAVVAIQRRPLLTPPPEQITTQNATQINQIETAKINQTIENKEPAAEELMVSIAPVVKAKAQPLEKKTEKSPVVKPKKLPTPPKKTPPVKKVVAEEYARIQNTPGIHTLQKNVSSPRLNQNVMQAYTAFQSGDDTSAKKIYQAVLQQDQNNRDALLGLAAIAIRQDQPQQAEQYYKRILKQYPQDTNAQLGLISVLGNKAPEYTESQLKQFIDKNPKFAYGYFNLGNYYASLNQWEKAQQAYFEAYQYDEQQINYAYNLAISLDQLNQYVAASLYYQRALQLSARTPHHELDIHAIQQRLQTLTQSTTSSALTALSAKSLAQD